MAVTVRVINTDCVKGYIQVQCGYSGMILTVEDARQLVSDLNEAIKEQEAVGQWNGRVDTT